MKRILPLLFLAMSLPLFAQNLPSGTYNLYGGNCTASTYFDCTSVQIRNLDGTPTYYGLSYKLYPSGGGGTVWISYSYASSGETGTVALGNTDFDFNFSDGASFSGAASSVSYYYHSTYYRGYRRVWYSVASGTLTIN